MCRRVLDANVQSLGAAKAQVMAGHQVGSTTIYEAYDRRPGNMDVMALGLALKPQASEELMRDTVFYISRPRPRSYGFAGV